MVCRTIILFSLIICFSSAQNLRICYDIGLSAKYCSDSVNYNQKLYSDLKNKGLGNQKLFLYKTGKCIDTVFTDKKGILCIKLKKGSYQLFMPYKHYKLVPFGNNENFDLTCLRKDWAKPDAVIKIKFLSHVFINYGIGFYNCPDKHPCLKQLNIQEK
jgi:hypothetical protein